jgi:uncharacterized protein with PQ loop repeat
MELPLIAGAVSTVLFAASVIPMLAKAARTKDMASYSLSYIALSNLANAIHSVYILSLPPGPIWILHGFYVVAMALMLVWFLCYRRTDPAPTGSDTAKAPIASEALS